MKYLIAIIIVISTTIGFGSHVFAKEGYLKLQPVEQISGSSNFNAVEVLDLRTNKGSMGKLRGHSFFQVNDLNTEDSFHVALKNMALSVIDSASEKKDGKLIIVLHDLQYKSQISMRMAISTVYLKLDCYLQGNDGFRHVVNMDSLYEYIGVKAESRFDLFNMVINYLFTEAIIKAAVQDSIQDKLFSSEEDALLEDKRLKSKIPIFNEQPHNGVYYTSAQFLKNTPADSNFIRKSIWGGHTGDKTEGKFYLYDASGVKSDHEDTTWFAIYDQKNRLWYHLVENKSVQIMELEQGDYYYHEVQKGTFVEDYSSVPFIGFQYNIRGRLSSAGIARILANVDFKKKDALYRVRFDPLKCRGIRVARLK
jgi:hypothetical protein